MDASKAAVDGFAAKRRGVFRAGMGEPLLLLHAGGASWRLWTPVLPQLVAERDVLALTLLGHRGGPPLPAGQSLAVAAIADAVERELDTEGLDQVDIVGNSLGGYAALELARRGRARSVVAIAPMGMQTDAQARASVHALLRGHRIARALRPVVLPALAMPSVRRRLLRAALGLAHGERVPTALARHIFHALTTCDIPAAFSAGADGLQIQNVGEITTPILIIHGDRDPVAKRDQIDRYLTGLPDARLVRLTDAGHCPQLEQPARVAEEILRFTHRPQQPPPTFAPARTDQPNNGGIPIMITASTLCAAFQQTAQIAPDAVALRSSDGDHSITWRQYSEQVQRIAGGLAALGVSRGDTVALMLSNRPEFFLADVAATHLGATAFSLYNSSSPAQLSYVLKHATPTVVICEQQYLDTLDAAEHSVEHVLCLEHGDLERLRPADDFDFQAAWQSVTPDDVLTLIYTSGTTGPPKGVEITHRAILAQLEAMTTEFDFRHGDRCLSYLPPAHIAERVAVYYPNIVFGTTVTSVKDMKTINQVLPQVRPTTWGGVPRIWEKAKDGIEAKIATQPRPQREIARWAIRVATSAERHRAAGRSVPPTLAAQVKLADALVLGKLRSALGMEQVRWAVTGSAATPVEVFEFFRGIGIPLTDVWGMSEIGVATAAAGDTARAGTVGRPLPGVEIRLADDGELLLRSPWVMKGYRNDPERTAEAIDTDGWLHTGDIFSQDADGYLRMLDRKKELIINAGGKNMSPGNIQAAIATETPLIGSVMAVGDGRPYNVALIVLDPDEAAAYAARHGISADPAVLAEDERVHATIQAGVHAGNAKLSRVEQIKRFTILPTYWEPGGDEVTPTMKLRRKNIAARYTDEIDKLYATPAVR